MQIRTSYTRLPFAGNFTISESGAGIGCSRSFCLNDVYDPDVSLSNTGLTQWSSFYSRFLVVRADVILTLQMTIDAIDTVAGFLLNPGTTALLSAPVAWTTAPYGKMVPLGPLGSAAACRMFTFVVHPWVPLGLTKRQYLDDPDFYCTPIASPVRKLYMLPAAYSKTTATVVTGTVKIVYHVQMFKPVLQPES